MDIRTGGIVVSTTGTSYVKPSKGYRYSFDIAGKALYADMAALTELIEEIMNHTVQRYKK